MPNKPFINIVGTKCPPQDEARFNKWYNEVHIPMLMKYKGLKNVARYKVASEAGNMPTYLAIYEFASQKDFEAYGKSPEFKAAIDEMHQSWPAGIEMPVKTQYELIKNW